MWTNCNGCLLSIEYPGSCLNIKMSSHQYRDSHYKNQTFGERLIFETWIPIPEKMVFIWVRSRRCGYLVTRFCYQLIAKPGNKTATVSWSDPYWDCGYLVTRFCYQLIAKPGNKTAAVSWSDPYWDRALDSSVKWLIPISFRNTSWSILIPRSLTGYASTRLMWEYPPGKERSLLTNTLWMMCCRGFIN